MVEVGAALVPKEGGTPNTASNAGTSTSTRNDDMEVEDSLCTLYKYLVAATNPPSRILTCLNERLRKNMATALRRDL